MGSMKKGSAAAALLFALTLCGGHFAECQTAPEAAGALPGAAPGTAPGTAPSAALTPALVASFTRREVFPAPGRASVKMLSDYLPSLAGGPGDSPVYFIDGKEPGGTVFVCAGTHGNEISGVVAAAILAEKVQVLKGRLIVLPRANESASGYPDPEKPGPSSIRVATARGDRVFFFGARRTNPADEGAPDPAEYLRPDSKESQAGMEIRNLDRNYPGTPAGGLTARVAYAIMTLIQDEKVDVAFDLHESAPDSKLAWIVVANPKNVDLAALAVLDLEDQGIRMIIDASAEEPRGLSHREWGDRTKAKAFLIETPNPAQGTGALKGDPASDPSLPLARRVAVQLAAFSAIMDVCDDELPEPSQAKFAGIPSPDELAATGLGAFLE